MGSWEVSAVVAALLIGVVGAVAVLRRARRRRREAAERLHDDEVLREEVLERLRQVLGLEDERDGATSRGAQQVGPPDPPATRGPWEGPVHVDRRERRGGAWWLARAVVATLVLSALVGLALVWIAGR